MTWQHYPYYLIIVLALWIAGLIFLYIPGKRYTRISQILLFLGFGVLAVFTIQLWVNLERPPFRSLGETRLWYGIFLSVVGLVLYHLWKFKWILLYSKTIAAIFLLIICFKPGTFDQTLMPALQSPWFIPHVIVYIFAYALLTAATIIAAKELYLFWKNKNSDKSAKESLVYADNLVYIGLAFLTFGLLFGALWAKEAWGHYWTWDPKETWSLITWLVYLLYIHFRHRHKGKYIIPFWILIFAMIFLLICWFGVNYLPSTQSSIHTY
ncbi:MAG: cytochrome c biogenesis protein CcsA [Bacteroidales bacterium]